MMRTAAMWLVVALAAAGCATDYSWRTKVPVGMRSVSVPVFRNESEVTELGAVSARELLREFQREGTFAVARPGDGAIEIQGIVKNAKSSTSVYNRGRGARFSDIALEAKVEISVIDKKRGKVLVDGRVYTCRTTFVDNEDFMSSRRDASGRLAEDLARQVVDDVLGLKWYEENQK